MAATYDIAVKQGDSFTLAIRLEQPSGTPMDLTGFAVRSQIRRGAALLAEFHVAVQPAAGRIVMTLMPDQTLALTQSADEDVPSYDVVIASTDRSYVRRMVRGDVTILPAITRF
jgi:hypothetical protein